MVFVVVDVDVVVDVVVVVVVELVVFVLVEVVVASVGSGDEDSTALFELFWHTMCNNNAQTAAVTSRNRNSRHIVVTTSEPFIVFFL